MEGMPEVPVVAYTPRLLLRQPTSDDARAVRSLRQNAHVMRYLGGPVPDAAAAERFDLDLAHWERYGYGKCVAEARASGEFVGYCGLQVFEGEPDLGYLLSPDWWGQGLATESACASLRYGFTHLQLRLVRALAGAGNRGSQRVLTKAGMRYLRDRVLWGNRQRCYAITAGEWEARSSLEAPSREVWPPSGRRAAGQ